MLRPYLINPYRGELRSRRLDIIQPAEIYDPTKGQRPQGRPNAFYVHPINGIEANKSKKCFIISIIFGLGLAAYLRLKKKGKHRRRRK